MKAVWGLALSAVLLLTSHESGSVGMGESTTTWDSLTTEEITGANNTSTSDESNNDRVTVQAPSPPIYSTGVLSASEFQRISKVQDWIYLHLEPFALVLLVLSAVAFLQDRQFASNSYLAALCLCEAWYMLMLLIHYSCRQQPGCFNSLTYTRLSMWSVSYTGMVTRRCVIVLNGLLSFQRYLAIAFPLKVRTLQLLQKPRILMGLLLLFSFLLHLYRPLQYTPVLITDGEGGESWTQGFSALFKAHKQVFLVLADLSKYLMSYVPMLVCLVSNCLMLLALGRHNKDLRSVSNAEPQKEQDNSKSKTERQMTVTILMSTFLMLLFNTPININEAVSMYSDHYGMLKKDHYLYLVLRSSFSIVSQVCDVLVILSYLILSAAFRRRFLALFSPLRRVACRKSSAAHASSMTEATAVNSISHTTSLELTSTPQAITKMPGNKG